MVTIFDVKRIAAPSAVSMLQMLALLMIGLLVFSLCIPILTAEADGWNKLAGGAGLWGFGATIFIMALTAPVTVPAAVVGTGLVVGGLAMTGSIPLVIGGGEEIRQENPNEASSGSCGDSGSCDEYSG